MGTHSSNKFYPHTAAAAASAVPVASATATTSKTMTNEEAWPKFLTPLQRVYLTAGTYTCATTALRHI